MKLTSARAARSLAALALTSGLLAAVGGPKWDQGGPRPEQGLLGIRSNGKRTTTRLLDAEFPKFRQLLPAEHTAVATLEIAPLVDGETLKWLEGATASLN